MARTFYGNLADGTPVHAYRLGAGDVTATVLDFGGTITAIDVPVGGAVRNIVLGLHDLSAYEASGRWNSLIGRYANRLRNGVTIEKRRYPLAQDANGITLHGAGKSWGGRMWDVVEASETVLRLRLVSPDQDQGFPGTVTTEVTYTMTADALRLDYGASSDAPTVINLTNHIYFNLLGQGSVTQHLLQLNADHVTPTDARQIPTGEITQVANTAFDFRQAHVIGRDVDSSEPQMQIAHGYDHNFVLNKSAPDALDWAARLSSPDGSLMLEVLTTEPGIQVYSINAAKPGRLDPAGVEIKPRFGLALETQHFPDSPNQPGFPTTSLNPGKPFKSSTVFRIGRR